MSAAPDNERSRDIVVFSIVRESRCSECGCELGRGAMLRKEGDGVLCLACADLDHLVFLPRGDAALTRRASRHSELRAVVVRFSRARKRYERQGILVQEAALEQAERECLEDADARAARREREAERRSELDARYVDAFAKEIGLLFPGCPEQTRRRIAMHACRRHSGRVGRSAAAKRFEAEAIELAVAAHVRHTMTTYDRLLARGFDRREARREVAALVEEICRSWRSGTGATNGSGPNPEPGF